MGETTPYWTRRYALQSGDSTRFGHFSSRDSRLDFLLRFVSSNFIEVQYKEDGREKMRNKKWRALGYNEDVKDKK